MDWGLKKWENSKVKHLSQNMPRMMTGVSMPTAFM